MKNIILRTIILSSFLISFIELNSNSLQVYSWNKITVKEPTRSAGFITVADLDGDGKKEILMSSLMESGSPAKMSWTKGALRIFSNSGNTLNGPWAEEVVISTSQSLPFVNKPFAFDVNGDSVLDIVVGTGFLNTNGGSLQWLAGPDFKELKPFTENTKKGNTEYFWHECDQTDLDNDGLQDIVTTSAKQVSGGYKVRVEWLRNTGNGNYSHYLIDETVGGVFIKLFDVDSDGDKDIVVSNFFTAPTDASLLWLENVVAPSESNSWKGEWVRHNIDATTGKGYSFEFFDIDNDSKLELVYNNHNNTKNKDIIDEKGNRIPSGIYSFEFPENPKKSNAWGKTAISEGWEINAYDFGNPSSQGSPGIISIGDLDENGMPDIMVPGDGTDNLWVLWQKNDGTFIREKVDDGQMYGSTVVTDLDNDNKLEVVSTMHEFPDGFWSALWNSVPDGHIKIYQPKVAGSSVKSESESSIAEKGPEKKEQELFVWPNPAKGQVYFKTQGDISLEKISIYNLSGKEFATMVYDTGENNVYMLQIDKLPAGMFIIRIGSTGEYGKFIVTK